MKRKRLLFAVAAVILLAVEIIIGLYVHDSFVRPYLGDTLAVMLIWCVLRIVFPTGKPWLSAAVFLFAVLVETTQIFPLCDLPGVRNCLVRTQMGRSFAWGDIVAYLAGCLVTAAGNLILTKRQIGA